MESGDQVVGSAADQPGASDQVVGSAADQPGASDQVVGSAADQPGASDQVGAVPEPAASSFIYALGRISPRFPSVAVEKEFAQATGRTETASLTDQQAAQAVLQSNRYLVRQLCWVFAIEGLDTYILVPRDTADLDLLVAAMRAVPRATDVDVVIGTRGPVAPPQACNGLSVPIVVFDQLYSFDVDALINALPKPEDVTADQFGPIAEEIFTRIVEIADNSGATDEHRALNYLAVRYDAIYSRAAEMYNRNFSLSMVDVRPSRLSGVRTIVDVVFTFTQRQTGVAEQYFTRVDVTEEFPFLFTKLTPFYER
jgi:PatG Domain